jgi:hypothetical protein
LTNGVKGEKKIVYQNDKYWEENTNAENIKVDLLIKWLPIQNKVREGDGLDPIKASDLTVSVFCNGAFELKVQPK